MQTSLKEHRSRVSAIKISNNNENAISCSFDGSTIIWDLNTYQRCICLFESTMFREVLYHPNESQVLTTGSNRKVRVGLILDHILGYFRRRAHSDVGCIGWQRNEYSWYYSVRFNLYQRRRALRVRRGGQSTESVGLWWGYFLFQGDWTSRSYYKGEGKNYNA